MDYCQIDEATVLCGLKHLRRHPDPDIVQEFRPFISTDTLDLRRLEQRLRDWGMSPATENTDQTDPETRRPVLTMVSALVESARGSALVTLPARYGDLRVLRVETRETNREAAALEARENALAILADDDPYNLPHVDELRVACIDSAIEQFSNRFTLVWRADEQQQIRESHRFNDVVKVLPGSEVGDGWLKVVTLQVDGEIIRVVGRGLNDGDVMQSAIETLEDQMHMDLTPESVVFCDPVIQSNGDVFVVHV